MTSGHPSHPWASRVNYSRGTFDGGTVSEEDIKKADLQHKCEHCGRAFNSQQGLSIHVSRWCGEATREFFPSDFEVDKIIEARGSPDNRYYKVQWKGTNTSGVSVMGTNPGEVWEPTREPARYLDTAPKAVDDFYHYQRECVEDNQLIFVQVRILTWK